MDNYALFQDYLQLDHQIDEFYHTLAQRVGLSDSALWVLWSLMELGEGCPEKLERDGLLALRPREGREVSLSLTGRGRELVRRSVLPVMEAERTAARGLTEEEWRTIIGLSRKWLSLFREAAASIPRSPKG